MRRLTGLLLALSLVLAAGASAGAAQRVTVRATLVLPAADDDTVDLRARGTAPRGATLVVRFYRGSRRIGTRRPALAGTRYAVSRAIRRTGGYTVRVIATRRDGTRVRASDRVTYRPTAEAPSAPGPD